MNPIKSRQYDRSLFLNLQIFNDFMNYYKAQRSSLRSPRVRGNLARPSDQGPSASELDQEINEQKRLFSNLCKEIGNTLTPESLESEYDES